jgi:hypothetical protein
MGVKKNRAASLLLSDPFSQQKKPAFFHSPRRNPRDIASKTA